MRQAKRSAFVLARLPVPCLGGTSRAFGSFLLLALCLAFDGTAYGETIATSTGPGQGRLVGGDPDGGCGELLFHADDTYENGYAWQYGGVQPPDYGAFAELRCRTRTGVRCRL